MDAVRALLQLGVDTTLRDENGYTALGLAVVHGVPSTSSTPTIVPPVMKTLWHPTLSAQHHQSARLDADVLLIDVCARLSGIAALDAPLMRAVTALLNLSTTTPIQVSVDQRHPRTKHTQLMN